MEAIDIVGISGSLRSGSYNTALLRAAEEELPAGTSLEIVPIRDLPMYDWDLEQEQGFPEPVRRLRDRVAAADALLLASPEYNFSVTGALKNAIDWLSRGREAPIDRLPAAIVGVGGGSGTARSQRHLRDILAHNRLRVVAEPAVLVSRGRDRFDVGRLVDDDVRRALRSLVERLVAVVERERTAPSPDLPGSVLVVEPSAARARRIAEHLAEYGARTLHASDPTEARSFVASRSIAAVVGEPVPGKEVPTFPSDDEPGALAARVVGEVGSAPTIV